MKTLTSLVDIEKNAWSWSIVNLKINLIFNRYPMNNQSEARKFCVQSMGEQRNCGYPKSSDQADSS